MVWLVGVITFVVGVLLGWWLTRATYAARTVAAEEIAASARSRADAAQAAIGAAEADAKTAQAEAKAAETAARTAEAAVAEAQSEAASAVARAEEAGSAAETAATEAAAAKEELAAAVARAETAERAAEEALAAAETAKAEAASAMAAAAPLATVAEAAESTLVVSPSDLTRIEGVGPKIAELLHGGGILTFAELAATPVESLQHILDAGGPRYRIHDPSTWPEQAGLAADERWQELDALQERLSGGRPG